MNIDGVRAFVAVAEAGQFRIAADELGISQQAVSKRVAALEHDLGAVLFDRVPSGASLTADGRTFLPRARAVLTAVRQAVESVRQETRPLRVDVLTRKSAPAALLREIHRSDPIELEMITSNGLRSASRALSSGEIDAAFAYVPSALELAHTPALLERLHVVVGPGNPLAARKAVALTDLAPFRIWIPGIADGSEWGRYYEELAVAFGLDIDATATQFGTEALLDTIAESRSVVTLNGDGTRMAWPQNHGLVRIPITDPAPHYPWSILWHPGNAHPALPTLLDHVRQRFTPVTDAWLPRAYSPKPH